jgi:hypothetical protein
MNYRVLPVICMLAVVSALVSLVALTALGQSATSGYAQPHTPWGDPDLQGIWTNIDEGGTPFERPPEYEAKSYDDEELRELARARQERVDDPEERKRRVKDLDETRALGETGNGPVHWYEYLDPTNSRPWVVSDPPDGRLPPSTPEALKKLDIINKKIRGRVKDQDPDGPNDPVLSPWVRCITRGLPAMILPLAYDANYQIVQTPGYVAILYEEIHETRVIPLDGRPHARESLRQWLGDSRGHWEGNTLVVDVTNFSGKADYRGSGEHMHLIERFTRVAPDTIDYRFTVDDSTTWTRPWTAAIPLKKDDKQEQIFEYACHEGNYGLLHIFSGTRAMEKATK